MKKWLKILLWVFALLFICMNIIAAIHAYKFTHFSAKNVLKTKPPYELSWDEKLKVLFSGIANPRIIDSVTPKVPYRELTIKSNKELDCWFIPSAVPKGTVIMFHGYANSKSSLINNALQFDSLGYNTLLVDFMGAGKSEGNETTIGCKEAQEVIDAYKYILHSGEKSIYLFGQSMGSAAIITAMHNDSTLHPAGLIIECPFSSMYRTVCNRFQCMGVPVFPMASLLTFWGGIENGFWAFSFSPSEYAKSVKCPTLLMYGDKDKYVGRDEIDEIYNHLAGKKHLSVFPGLGHQNYFNKYPSWTDTVSNFLRNADTENRKSATTPDNSIFQPQKNRTVIN